MVGRELEMFNIGYGGRVMDCIACPDCGSKVKVTDSRYVEVLGFKTKRRRRHCLVCSKRFNTVELPESFVKDVFGEGDDDE